MHPVIQFLLVVAVSISGLAFAVSMFPKGDKFHDDNFPDDMA